MLRRRACLLLPLLILGAVGASYYARGPLSAGPAPPKALPSTPLHGSSGSTTSRWPAPGRRAPRQELPATDEPDRLISRCGDAADKRMASATIVRSAGRNSTGPRQLYSDGQVDMTLGCRSTAASRAPAQHPRFRSQLQRQDRPATPSGSQLHLRPGRRQASERLRSDSAADHEQPGGAALARQRPPGQP